MNVLPKLFDSHCHLNDSRLLRQTAELLNRSVAQGICRMLVVGCDEPSSYQALEIAKKSGEVEILASVGIHPHDAKTVAGGISEELIDLANNPAVHAIGECGLDFFYDNSPRDVQERVFIEQIKWARQVQKPIIVHLRNAEREDLGNAYRDGLNLLKKYSAHECGGVLHCFSGELEHAYQALDLGFYISFAGPITFPKSEGLRDIARKIPINRILCETDCPYLAPQKYRGKQNEPAYVREVYEKIAEVRGISLSECAEVIWENGITLFGGGNRV